MKGLIVVKYNERRINLLQLKYSKPPRIRKRTVKRVMKGESIIKRNKI